MQTSMAHRQTHHQRRLQPRPSRERQPGNGNPPTSEDYVHYTEPDDHCSICVRQLNDREEVCRVKCGHVFHYSCWYDYCQHNHQTRARPLRCPSCNGNPVITARFPYVATGQRQELQDPRSPFVRNVAPPTEQPRSRAPSHSSVPVNSLTSWQQVPSQGGTLSGTHSCTRKLYVHDGK